MVEAAENPADAAGRIALQRMFACLDDGSSFRLEAGAGAGKTFSLDKALRRLIDRRVRSFFGLVSRLVVSPIPMLPRTRSFRVSRRIPLCAPRQSTAFAGPS